MANAMVGLANMTLSGAQSTVTFSNISQLYRDLQVVVTPKGSGGNGLMGAVYNSDTGSNYPDVFAYGEGSTAGSGVATRSFVLCSLSSIGTTFNPVLTMTVFDYSSTDKHKTTLVKYGNNDVSGVMVVSSRWASTAAVTSITFKFAGTDTFAAGSTFALYGVSA